MSMNVCVSVYECVCVCEWAWGGGGGLARLFVQPVFGGEPVPPLLCSLSLQAYQGACGVQFCSQSRMSLGLNANPAFYKLYDLTQVT